MMGKSKDRFDMFQTNIRFVIIILKYYFWAEA